MGKLTLLRLPGKIFREQFGELTSQVETNFKRRVIEGVVIEGTRLCDKLPIEAQDELVNKLKEVTFAPGETIIEQGEVHDTLYIIKSGVARVQQASAIPRTALPNRNCPTANCPRPADDVAP